MERKYKEFSMSKIMSFFTILISISTLLIGQDRFAGLAFQTRSELMAQRGMAATSQPLATQAALDILKLGGSAVDAAIAANAVLAVVEPMNCGLGGDLFAMVWDEKEGRLSGLNGSGRSPGDLSLKDLKHLLKKQGLDELPIRGALTVSVPGCVDAWFVLHKRYGKISMKQILAPAIYYARNGFPVSEVIAFEWREGLPLLNMPGFREVFTLAGEIPQKGQLFCNPALADSLERIARDGRDAFYKGEIAKKLIAFLQKNGGYLTQKDLQKHHSEWVEPVSTTYRAVRLWELPPNGQGIAALQMLNILEGFNLAEWGFGDPRCMHVMVEAKKLAYEDRGRYYTDPDFSQVPVKKLISKEYGTVLRNKIDMNRAAEVITNPKLEPGDTIYLTVADDEGNMVSLIQSTYWEFGSGLVPPTLGFALQNRGQLFALDEQHANVYAPGKRPFHTIIPAFVTKDGRPYMSFGVMGGSMQPQGHVQILVNHLDFGMSLQEAGDAPRFRHSGSSQPTGSMMDDGGWLNLETGFPRELYRDLLKLGHRVRLTVGGYGGYQAIAVQYNPRVYIGASESRKDGQAAGY